MKFNRSLAALMLVGGLLTACDQSADVASANISRAADNFEINRRIVFVNGMTNDYLLEIEGRCSIKVDGADRQLEVTCKLSRDDYRKHFLGLATTVSYFVEQTAPVAVSEYRYRVTFKPEVILPSIHISTSAGEARLP